MYNVLNDSIYCVSYIKKISMEFKLNANEYDVISKNVLTKSFRTYGGQHCNIRFDESKRKYKQP